MISIQTVISTAHGDAYTAWQTADAAYWLMIEELIQGWPVAADAQ